MVPDSAAGADHLAGAAGAAGAAGVAGTATVTAPATAALAVRDLRTGYPGGPDVLRGITFEVRNGEILAVLGRNGAGKTTLLRAVSGLLPCRGGDIDLDGTSVRGVRPHRIARRGVGHVPEGRRVMPGMSVADNLLLGAFRIAVRREVDALLEEVLDYFPSLRRALKSRAGTLSGGQQQMLAIARALMSRPHVLLLDEPLTGLAPVIQDDVMATLSSLRTGDRAIVLVEQNAQRSLAVADRGVVLADGAVAVRGAAAQLLADPAVRQGYLGTEGGTAGGAQGGTASGTASGTQGGTAGGAQGGTASGTASGTQGGTAGGAQGGTASGTQGGTADGAQGGTAGGTQGGDTDRGAATDGAGTDGAGT